MAVFYDAVRLNITAFSPFSLRVGTPMDFSFLSALEKACFDPDRRDSDRALRRSLTSPGQEVWMLEQYGKPAGAMTLRLHPRTLRIYSLAIDPDCRGGGLGRMLLHRAEERAVERGARRMVLEVDAGNADLVAWYTRHGFRGVKCLPDYYGPGRPGVRLERNLEQAT
jgi:ribosomal protein S18 acetylase RimI-like enzyme